jgi:CrcB protein
MAESPLLKPVLVFVGSGAGGLLRYALGGLIQTWWGPAFPMGTMLVNISGCFAMGFLAAALGGQVPLREEYRLVLLVGVLGGYTTFSSFGRETIVLMEEGAWVRAGAYVLTSVIVGLAAVWLGGVLAGRVWPTAPA